MVLPLLARRRWRFAGAGRGLAAGGRALVRRRAADRVHRRRLRRRHGRGVPARQVPDARQARLGLAVAVGGAAIVVYNDPNHAAGDFVFIPALFAIAWLAGFALRERAAQAEAAEERARQAEREREATARVAVAEERARIARELHDIVAHAVSVMVLQVGAVRHNLPDALARTRTRCARRADRPHGAHRDAAAARRDAPRRRRGSNSRRSPASTASTRCWRSSAAPASPCELHVEGEPLPAAAHASTSPPTGSSRRG